MITDHDPGDEHRTPQLDALDLMAEMVDLYQTSTRREDKLELAARLLRLLHEEATQLRFRAAS